MKTKILLIFSLLIISCDYNDGRLNIKNNSNYNITFYYSKDTVLSNPINDVEVILHYKAKPNETMYPLRAGSKNAWSTYILGSKNKKLNIFIFNADTISKHPEWKYIIDNKLYKRYEFTEDELNKMNWTIEYP